MKYTVSRIGCAAACMALCLALGCSCSVLPPASGKPAAAASSVPTDKNGNLLYDSSRLDDGRLRMLYGYDSSGNSCTVLCGGKVLYQSFRSENVNLLQVHIARRQCAVEIINQRYLWSLLCHI